MVIPDFDMAAYRVRMFQQPVFGVVAAAAAVAVGLEPIDSELPDFSNYDRATYDARCLYARGVRRQWVGCQDEAVARFMIDAGTSEGIETVALYGLPYFGGSAWHVFDDIEACLRVGSDYGIRPVAMDAEIDAHTIWPDQPAPGSASQRNAELLQCRRMIDRAGLRPIVYTNASWWVPMHGNTGAFADCGLWLPTYGYGGARAQPIREVGFGGWKTCVAHQAGSTYQLCGRGRDINYLWEELDDEMTQKQYEELLVGMWSGSEERYTAAEAAALGNHALAGQTKPYEERVAIARFRQAEVVAGRAQSLGQRAAQGGDAGPVVVPPGTVIKVAGSVVVQ